MLERRGVDGYYCSRNRIRAALLRDRSALLRVTSRYFALLRVTSRYFARNNNETIIPQVSSQARTRASPKHVTCRYSAYFMGAYLLVTARWSQLSSVGRVGSAGLLIGPTRAAAPACRHHRAGLASRGLVAQRDQPASLLKVRRHLQHMIMPFVTLDKHACAFVPQVTGSPTCLWSQLSLHHLMEGSSSLLTWRERIGS